jgi:predicted DCC family thiol-disulfide oxidoreductase YuxK
MAYDADCGPCTRFKQAVSILDIHRKVDFIPLNIADESGLLDSVPSNLRHRSFHLVLPDKQVLSGANALPEVIGMFPAGRAFSQLIVGAPGGRTAMAFVYSVFARLHDTGSCKYRPTPAGRRNISHLPAKGFGIIWTQLNESRSFSP